MIKGHSPGAQVGVIMLDTAFPRPLGDIGNPATFGGRGLYEIVTGATAARIIEGDPKDPDLLTGFLAARDLLVARGAKVITTSCGILAYHQEALQRDCPAAVIASAMIALPELAQRHGQVGVMAMDSRAVTPALLAAVGAAADTPVIGLESSAEIYPVLRRNQASDVLDLARATQDVLAAAQALKAKAPGVTAILFECANLPPYRAAVARAMSLPVHDILTLITEKTGLAIAEARP